MDLRVHAGVVQRARENCRDDVAELRAAGVGVAVVAALGARYNPYDQPDHCQDRQNATHGYLRSARPLAGIISGQAGPRGVKYHALAISSMDHATILEMALNSAR